VTAMGTVVRFVVFLLFAALAPSALAQAAYPSKPIRFIAPFPPGGATDTLCRLLAQKLGDALGQPVTVENRPGASGNIGHELAVKAAPDGYTLLLTNSSTLTTNPHLFKQLPFDPLADFAPISLVATAGQVLVVHPSVPASSVFELVQLAKRRPGELNFGSGGKGIQSHISGEMFKSMTGISIVHVPYKGTVQAVADLVAGQVQLVFADMVPAMPHIKAGRLKPLAVTTAQRSSALPEVPTMIEAGVPGYSATIWWAVALPKGAQPALVQRLNAELGRVMAFADVQERYASLGMTPAHSSPQQVLELIRADTQKFGSILKAAGVEPE
jgi:tripartite-type tricarboxylate transporter receptor subunit TctC